MPAVEYLIFARRQYQQPLECIGRLQVEDGDGAEEGRAELDRRAREQFGAEGWVEMVAVPQAAARRVIPAE